MVQTNSVIDHYYTTIAWSGQNPAIDNQGREIRLRCILERTTAGQTNSDIEDHGTHAYTLAYT